MTKSEWKLLRGPESPDETDDQFYDRLNRMTYIRNPRRCADCAAVHEMEICPACASVVYEEIGNAHQ